MRVYPFPRPTFIPEPEGWNNIMGLGVLLKAHNLLEPAIIPARLRRQSHGNRLTVVPVVGWPVEDMSI